MNVANIRARLTRGFRPFALVTSSGEKYPVPHPEFILVTQRSVVVADSKGFTTLLDPLHITGIEDISVPPNRTTKRPRKQ